MTRYTFILSALALLLGSCVLISGMQAATEITATIQGQACVDTAVARGWLPAAPRRTK